jgi:hypothetical protein
VVHCGMCRGWFHGSRFRIWSPDSWFIRWGDGACLAPMDVEPTLVLERFSSSVADLIIVVYKAAGACYHCAIHAGRPAVPPYPHLATGGVASSRASCQVHITCSNWHQLLSSSTKVNSMASSACKRPLSCC